MFVDCMYRVPSRCCNRLSHTNIVPNVIQSHLMSGCGMLQAQGQNAMQFKCIQMSLDNSQTSQQTLVQWHQCQCCIVCSCVHAEQPGDWVAADSLSCTSMFSGDAILHAHTESLSWPKSWGGPIHCWSLQPKSLGTCLPWSCACCAYVWKWSITNITNDFLGITFKSVVEDILKCDIMVTYANATVMLHTNSFSSVSSTECTYSMKYWIYYWNCGSSQIFVPFTLSFFLNATVMHAVLVVPFLKCSCTFLMQNV